MKKPKIAIVVPALTEWGGLPTVAMFLREAINRSGRYESELISVAISARDSASVRLLSPRTWLAGPQIESRALNGNAFKHIGCYFCEFEFQRYLPRTQLTRILRSCDLIQIVSGTPMVGLVAASVRKPKCLNVATTILKDRRSALLRDRGVTKAWRWMMTGMNVGLERLALREMTHVFAESTYTRELLRGQVPEEKISLGPPGVDTRIFQPSRYKRDGYILSVGRFSDPRKNIRTLLKAYSLLRSRQASTPALVLSGFVGPRAEDWDFADQLGIRSSVHFREKPTTTELVKLYQDAALFVLASDEEGFGIVLLEAMSTGTPVICTRCGGPEDIISHGETGYLTPVNDPTALANQMEELLADPVLRERIGDAGRAVVARRFSLTAAGKAYLDKYDDLLDQRAGAGSKITC